MNPSGNIISELREFKKNILPHIYQVKDLIDDIPSKSDIESLVSVYNKIKHIDLGRFSDRINLAIDKLGSIDKLDIPSTEDIETLNSNIKSIKDDLKAAVSIVDEFHKIEKLFNNIDNINLVSRNIDSVGSVAENIDEITSILDKAKSITKTLDDSSKNHEEMLLLLKEIESKIKLFDTKFIDAKKMYEFIKKLSVSAYQLEPHQQPTATFINGTLRLGIPRGEKGSKGDKGDEGLPGIDGKCYNKGDKGDKGEKGADGKNFTPNAFGDLEERRIYNGAKKGFSFVSLSELPVMIYFKRTNKYGDWTKGYPYGVARLDDTEKAKVVEGIDVDRLIDYILPLLKKELK